MFVRVFAGVFFYFCVFFFCGCVCVLVCLCLCVPVCLCMEMFAGSVCEFMRLFLSVVAVSVFLKACVSLRFVVFVFVCF